MRFNKTPERKRKTSRDIQTLTEKDRKNESKNETDFKYDQTGRFVPEITHRSRIFSADDMDFRL